MPPQRVNKRENPEWEWLAVGAVAPHPKNPRVGNVAAIQASIRENGFFRPLIVQRKTKWILVGNHRYLAAIAEGYREVPVLWADVDARAALRILLADNRTADLGIYDERGLAELVSRAERRGRLAATGFAPADLEQIVARVQGASDQSLELKPRRVVVVGPASAKRLGALAAELQADGFECRLKEA